MDARAYGVARVARITKVARDTGRPAETGDFDTARGLALALGLSALFWVVMALLLKGLL